MNNPSKKKSITRLTKENYNVGSTLTLKNAENLLGIAEFCNQKQFYGNGTSILITSLEELSKAAYLKIKAHNPIVEIINLDYFFKYHKWKHDAILRLYSKSISDDLRTMSEEEQRIAQYVIIGAILIAAYFTRKNNQPIKFDLEKARQKGFYVDFIKDNTWHSPVSYITPEDFSEYLEIAKKTFDSVRKDLFEGVLSDINMKRYIEELSDENVYFRDTYKMI